MDRIVTLNFLPVCVGTGGQIPLTREALFPRERVSQMGRGVSFFLRGPEGGMASHV